MFSLNEDIFCRMNWYVPWNEYDSVKKYNCLEWLLFLWINICPLNKFFYLQLTSISFTWSWINTIPWSCINIQLLDVKQCLECKYILLNVNICISWFLHYLQTANHSQLWVVTQTNINYDLLVLCIPCEQRPLVYLLYPHEKCLCVPTTNPPLSLKFAFSLKTSDRGCNLCGRLGKQTSGN